MARVIAVSSQVVRGHVGLNAMLPALAACGHDVTAFPTILLSNHPGHGAVAGERTNPALLSRMLDTLDGHGWLHDVDAIVSGYLPSVEHVAFVEHLVERVRTQRPDVRYICDPVLGDDPKGLYIAQDAATAIRDRLLPRADVALPNRFELAWLTGSTVRDPASATVAAHQLGPNLVVATSIPDGADSLATLAVEATTAAQRSVTRRPAVPNGTGDLLAGLFAGLTLLGWPIDRALGHSVDLIEAVIAASQGRDELDLSLVTATPRVMAR